MFDIIGQSVWSMDEGQDCNNRFTFCRSIYFVTRSKQNNSSNNNWSINIFLSSWIGKKVLPFFHAQNDWVRWAQRKACSQFDLIFMIGIVSACGQICFDYTMMNETTHRSTCLVRFIINNNNWLDQIQDRVSRIAMWFSVQSLRMAWTY